MGTPERTLPLPDLKYSPDSARITPESAIDLIISGGKGVDRAFANFAMDSFLWNPDPKGIKDTISFIDSHLDEHFHKSPGKPDKKHAKDRILLAGVMGVTYFLLAQEALGIFLRSGGDVESVLGPQNCYLQPNPDREGDELIIYKDFPREDAHMRSISGLIIAGKNIEEQSHDRESPYARYKPLWELEEKLRSEIQIVDHKRNTQGISREGEENPLIPERIQQAGALFLRNTMHHILLTADSLPKGTPVKDIQQAVMLKIGAAETASQYPREIQRPHMGTKGSQYEEYRERYNIVPHIVTTAAGEARVAGLEKSPPNPSMCPGQDPHEIPSWLQNEYTPSFISLIGMFALYGTAIAPYTLFRDRPS